MLPSINHFYEYIGAEEKLRAHGFAKKVGAAAKFKQSKREACKLCANIAQISLIISHYQRHQLH